jgi:hypothetical protein
VYEPSVYLLYPEPGATNVPDGTNVLIYDSDDDSAPITLSAANGTALTTSPTSVPSPLPSPIATRNDPSEYAVRLPALNAATKYTAVADVRLVGCGANQPTTFRLGSFTTK